MEEIWKDVKGYEGYYQISNLGNVMSLKFNHADIRRLIKPFDNGGYNMVCFNLNGVSKKFLVHRLVAEAFIPNHENKPCVNHIDGNKRNNSVENLEWVTKSENTRHAIRIGLRPRIVICERKRGAENPISKAIAQFGLNGNKIAEYGCAKDAEKSLGFKHTFIQRCCRGERKTYMNYVWKYI